MDVQLVLLRSLLGELPLKPGTVMAARVIDARTIALAGVRMAATLPEGVEPGTSMRVPGRAASGGRVAATLPGGVERGAAMRVRVREASSERLLLQVVGRNEPADAAPA